MSYAIIRNENRKMSEVPLMERHNERKNKNYSNKDIDPTRTAQNYHIKQIQAATYQQEFERIRLRQELKGNLRLHGEKQSNVMCEFMITSDSVFFEHLGAERTKQFFIDAYNFVCAKVGGEQYMVSAVVHMDEATPHMHIAYIPVIRGKDRKGNPCGRINCSEFWKGRDSYSRLQDEYYDYMTSRGYVLERGEKGSTAEHLSVSEYKLQKTREQLKEAEKQLDEIDGIEEIKTTPLPLGMVTVKKSDLDKLSAAAKGYAVSKAAEKENGELKAELSKLKNDNADLREENHLLFGNLNQLRQDYDDFAETVADEVNLANENSRLSLENQRIGNQVHTLSAENEQLKKDADEMDSEIKTLTENLNTVRKMLNELQTAFDKAMKFIEQHDLKEKWERFKNPAVQHKARWR